MAKRNRSTTIKQIENWIKEGRGTGIGKGYKPWLKVQDVPSSGRSTRLNGIKTGRQHELLSDLERDYFYIVEYSKNVIDIREQYPLLPENQTELISNELGIKHPVDPKTKIPIVMTTDFLLTVKLDGKNVLLARTIKSKEDLMNERQIEKFEIEKRYWELQDVDWGVVTEDEIYDTCLPINLSIFHPFYSLADIELDNIPYHVILGLLQSLKSMLIGKTVNVREVSAAFDQKMLLPEGTGIAFFKHLVITKQIKLNLLERFDLDSYQQIEVNIESAITGDNVG
jgi:hypothetical protein